MQIKRAQARLEWEWTGYVRLEHFASSFRPQQTAEGLGHEPRQLSRLLEKPDGAVVCRRSTPVMICASLQGCARQSNPPKRLLHFETRRGLIVAALPQI